MTGAPLYSWQYERHLLQGGNDVFHDLEELAHKIKANTTTTTEPQTEVDTASQPSDDKAQYIQVEATEAFPNGWRTLFRINQKNPYFITHEYVDTLFQGAFDKIEKKPEESEEKEKKEENENSGKTERCIVM